MASPRPGSDAHLLQAAEKADIKSLPHSAGIGDQRPQASRKMPSRARMVFALTLCLLAAVGMASTVGPRKTWSWPCHRDVAGERDAMPESRPASFLTSLGGDSPESLNDLLRKFFPEKFPHDVLSPGQRETDVGAGPESGDDAAMGLLQIARRDGTNSTSSDAPASSTSSIPSQSSTSSAPGESQPPTSTTPTPSSTPGTTSTRAPEASTTTSAPASSTTSPTSKPTSTTGMSTSQSGTSSLSKSRPSSSGQASSTGGFATTTNKSETKGPQSSESSSLTTYTSTTTDSSGNVVIVTATTFVGAGVQQSTTGSAAQATDGLQTNAAPSANARGLGLGLVVLLVVGGALLA